MVRRYLLYNLLPVSPSPVVPELSSRLPVSPNGYVNGVGFSVRDVLGLDVDPGHVGRGTQPKSRAMLSIRATKISYS